MAARTTTGDAAESTNPWDGGTALGSTDTITSSHTITFDRNIAFGSSPASGGTEAWAIDNSVTQKNLTIAAGVTLTVKGDIYLAAANAPYSNGLVMGAGSTLKLLPASGQTYVIEGANFIAPIYLNGTSGAHVTVMTDLSSGGSAGYMSIPTNGSSAGIGVLTADYADFIDLGTDAQGGVRTVLQNDTYPSANVTSSLTHLTFTRCNYSCATIPAGAGWNGAYTFEDCIFDDSVTFDVVGFACCASFTFPNASPPAGFPKINRNGFDTAVSMRTAAKEPHITNNFFGGQIVFINSTNCFWSTAAQFDGNFIYGELNQQQINGPAQNCYVINTDASNPHFITATHTLTGCIFEAPHTSNDGAGDILSGGSATECIVLPGGAADTGTGTLTNGPATLLHNTAYGRSEAGTSHLNEAGANTSAGDVPACNSNLIWCEEASTSCLAICSDDPSGADHATDTVTEAVCNGFWNPGTGTCVHNTSTSQAGVVGYLNVRVSTAGAYPNAQVGDGDVTVSSDPFVDRTRKVGTWGSVIHATDGTHAAAAEICRADPTKILLAGANALIPWIRTGFNVTDDSLQDAGEDGVTIGAGEFVASGARSFALLGVGA